MEEVMNREDANYIVIISESYGLKRIILKAYFHLDSSDECGEMISYMGDYYGAYMRENTRLEIAKVIEGTVVGGRI